MPSSNSRSSGHESRTSDVSHSCSGGLREKHPVADKYQQVVFKVAGDATKPEVKAAVELLFNVKVDGVQMLNVKGKAKRFGRFTGRRSDWKKGLRQPG